MPKVTIDGLELNSEDLGERGRAVLASLQFVEGQLQRLGQEIAVLKTARASYARALRAEIAPDGAGGADEADAVAAEDGA
ncbi:MAG: DUF6447 family protein [Rhodobacteraceae bacterium]|nr:DUF6447 family protein [Paracoccaceae bacterium]